MHAEICTCIHACMHENMYRCTHAYTRICRCIRKFSIIKCTKACTHMCIYIWTKKQNGTYVFMQKRIHANVHALYVCMQTCTQISIQSASTGKYFKMHNQICMHIYPWFYPHLNVLYSVIVSLHPYISLSSILYPTIVSVASMVREYPGVRGRTPC